VAWNVCVSPAESLPVIAASGSAEEVLVGVVVVEVLAAEVELGADVEPLEVVVVAVELGPLLHPASPIAAATRAAVTTAVRGRPGWKKPIRSSVGVIGVPLTRIRHRYARG
jgi:hypothetical protein